MVENSHQLFSLQLDEIVLQPLLLFARICFPYFTERKFTHELPFWNKFLRIFTKYILVSSRPAPDSITICLVLTRLINET